MEEIAPNEQLELAFTNGQNDWVAEDDGHEAAEQGDPEAQFQLAQLYQYGAGGFTKDLAQAFVWYKASESRGHPHAGQNLAAISSEMSLNQRAQAGFLVGKMYEESTRVVQDFLEALNWFREAAVRGHAEAPLRIGKMYEEGRAGLPTDIVKAYAWVNVSARLGNENAKPLLDRIRDRLSHAEFASACLELGGMYRTGREIPKDGTEALYWYRRATDEGIAEAECAIGEMYRSGDGVAADDRKAFESYRKAANRGLTEAQREIGDMYLNGEGAPKRLVEGLAWLYVAARQEPEAAEIGVREAEKRMTGYEISKAQSLSREYLARISQLPHACSEVSTAESEVA